MTRLQPTHRSARARRAVSALSLVSTLALFACAAGKDATDYVAAPTGHDAVSSEPMTGHAELAAEDVDEESRAIAGEALEQAPAPKAEAQADRSDERKVARGKKRGGKALAKSKRHDPTIAVGASPAPFQVQPEAELDAEAYDHIAENGFKTVADDPLSTFSIDVDTASYANTRRLLNDGVLPPPDAVRIEELINYFSYRYRAPTGDDPFSVTTEVSDCPWNPDARLVHVGLMGKQIAHQALPPRNLVFLLDVSGSMDEPDKLPLLKQSMKMLVGQLDDRDRVSIVVYAGASGVVLEPTRGDDHARILDALDRLGAGGSTNGGAGIELAYALAERNFDAHGINRVILATDGDFNVGTTSRGELERLIERKRESGVFLSVLGFGTGNVKDSQMEMLADKGNGNYAYIDGAREAHKVLVQEAGSTLVTIAKDVKIQVEFNPAQVASYRLVGYENRALAHEDFNDDAKDAGEIGAGHTVTALYEVIPAGRGARDQVDGLRYQQERRPSAAANSGELMLLKLRYKLPHGSRSKLISFPVADSERTLARASEDFRFSAAVAEFGMLLRGSQHLRAGSFAQVRSLAERALGEDPNGHRREFLALIDAAARLQGEGGPRIAR